MEGSYAIFTKEKLLQKCDAVLEKIERRRATADVEYIKNFVEEYNNKFWRKFLVKAGMNLKLITKADAPCMIEREKKHGNPLLLIKHMGYPSCKCYKTHIVAEKLIRLAESADSEDILVGKEDWNELFST